MNTTIVSVDTVVNAPMKKVWHCWTNPECIKEWNNASDDWHTPHAENDLRTGGSFISTMASKDGSQSFDFKGVYDVVAPESHIEYTLEDERKVKIKFLEEKNGVHITETFDAEKSHPVEMQKEGWQAILNNFKKYVENSDK